MASWNGVLFGLGAAALLGMALPRGAPPPRLIVPAKKTQGDRVVYPKPVSLPGSDQVVRSVLNVPAQMRFGEFVWNDTGVPDGPIWIRVDRKAQLVSVFRGPDEIGTAVILYGAPDKRTPHGHYPILEKLRDHRSRTYDADMPFTLRLTDDGIAIHASDVRAGYATHGCIGLPAAFARRLFDRAQVGDIVVIV